MVIKNILNSIKGCISGFIPDVYRQDKETVSTIYRCLAAGLLIRALLIPFTTSTDLLWINWRAHLIVYHKQFFLGSTQMLTHYIHAFFMWLFSPLMPYYDEIWTHPWTTTHPKTPAEISQMVQTFYNFVSHPRIFRTLTLLKLPYLLFDLGCISLILRMFKHRQKGMMALKFWVFNPINIFVIYIYGRFELIPVILILVSLYLLKKSRPFSASLMLGISITTRWYPALLLPFYLITCGRSKIEKLCLFILGVLPVCLMSLLARIGSQPGEIALFAKTHHVNYLLSMNFDLGLHDTVYLFVTGYVLLCLYLVYRQSTLQISPAADTQISFQQTVRFSLAAFLLLFATCYFHLQFFVWPIVFLTLYIPYERRLTKLFYFACMCWWIYTWQWGRVNTTYLLLPIFPEAIINWPSPGELMERFYPAHKFIGIFRSTLSAILLAMMFLVLKPTPMATDPKR